MNKRENIVKYREIGEVRYVKNRRAKHLSIRINQQGEVRVTVPGAFPMRRAEAFLMSKKPWIQTKLGEIGQTGSQFRLPEVGDVVNIRGKELQIALRAREQNAEEAL